MIYPQQKQTATIARGLLVACALLLAGCASGLLERSWPAAGESSPSVELEGPGKFRLALWQEEAAPPWNVLSIRNSGSTPVEGIRLWNFGRSSLLVIDDASGPPPEPFMLLPGEQLVITETVEPETGIATLTGVFYWDWPLPGGAEVSWPGRTAGMIDGGGQGFRLHAGPEQAFVQVILDAPLPMSGLRVGWAASAGALTLGPYISTDMGVWARPGSFRPNVRLDRPADLGQAVQGERRFGLRIAADAPEGKAGSVAVARLRVEREFKAIGKLGEWPVGHGHFRVDVAGPPDARLTLRLDAF